MASIEESLIAHKSRQIIHAQMTQRLSAAGPPAEDAWFVLSIRVIDAVTVRGNTSQERHCTHTHYTLEGCMRMYALKYTNTTVHSTHRYTQSITSAPSADSIVIQPDGAPWQQRMGEREG